MKKTFSTLLVIALLGCMHSTVFAAELLDVKPVVAGNSVSIEVSADIAMTYTYYKVPGQARAVVDIAEADPEKVEPLIVVNKGAVSSISVDKALISGIVVSRIIFNLVSETDISVSASADRKLLTVTFGGTSSVAAKPEPKSEPKPEPQPKVEPKPAPVAEPVAVVAPPAESPAGAANVEEDPLGLDEPAAKPVTPAAKAVPAPAAATGGTVVPKAPTIIKAPAPVSAAPVASPPARPSALSIKEVVTGASYIEIRTSQPVTDYKAKALTNPDRLFIDIFAENIDQKPKSVAINKFGIAKTRIGVSPKYIRVVIDSGIVGFPAHTISKTADGLRINFK